MTRWTWRKHVVVYDDDLDRERELSYKNIDEQGFGWLTVFVAGAGFLTDIYDIVAGNVVLPMLAIVYWKGDIPLHEEKAITLATLIGTLIGQISFGVLADRYGRKGVYGVVLIIMMVAAVGLSLSSRGVEGSVKILPLLVVWRLLLGFGIGGDMPLSAAITAEFAPCKHRARMLATVYFMKPIGEILAHAVAVVAIAKNRRQILHDTDPKDCNNNKECLLATDNIWRWVVGFGAILPAAALILRLQIPESVRYTLEVEKDIQTARNYRTATPPTQQDTSQRTSGGQPPSSLESGSHLCHPQGSRTSDSIELHQYEGQGENQSIGDSRGSIGQASQNERRQVKKETWGEFWRGFREFLFKWEIGEDGHWTGGNWRSLAGTSLTCMLLDFSFYFLGFYNPRFTSKLWRSPEPTNIYSLLMRSSWQALMSNSIGALIGGTLFIVMARYRYNLQLYGFLVLAVLFVVVGVGLITLSNSQYFGATIVFQVLYRLFFNFGPNPSVFIIPAEVFPTRFRCTCHGISAAGGKLGSIFAQLIVESGSRELDWFGKVILTLTICNISGAVLTKFWVPNPCHDNGESKSLEDLGRGRRGDPAEPPASTVPKSGLRQLIERLLGKKGLLSEG